LNLVPAFLDDRWLGHGSVAASSPLALAQNSLERLIFPALFVVNAFLADVEWGEIC